MAFGSTIKTKKSVDDYFKPISHQKATIRIAVYSRAKQGKTHFCISSAQYLISHNLPGYVWAIDTEGDFHINVSTWPQEVQDRIRLFNAVEYLDKKNKTVDLVKSLTLYEEAIDVLTDMILSNEELPEEDRKYGFIVIDSGTDAWEWLSLWLETIETKKVKDKSGKDLMMQTEWGKANRKYMDMLRMLLATKWHVIITFRAHQAFDGSTPLKFDLPKWQKNTDFWLNLVMEVKKVPEPITGLNEHWFYFKGGRFGDIPEIEPMINPTWEDVKNKVGTYSSLEFV
ncbi:MAG: ATP-binding protein [Proteobacteria bacterium]|jgi:hypothetical protein|nr:ATP-binding protein [Pseudomonadota bacterium]